MLNIYWVWRCDHSSTLSPRHAIRGQKFPLTSLNSSTLTNWVPARSLSTNSLDHQYGRDARTETRGQARPWLRPFLDCRVIEAHELCLSLWDTWQTVVPGRVVCSLQPVMDTIISLMLHPRLTDKLASGNKSGWLDPIIPLTLFLAFGIFTVTQKYHKKHNSPIPFQYPVPQVRLHWPFITMTGMYVDTYIASESRFQRRNYPRCQSQLSQRESWT